MAKDIPTCRTAGKRETAAPRHDIIPRRNGFLEPHMTTRAAWVIRLGSLAVLLGIMLGCGGGGGSGRATTDPDPQDDPDLLLLPLGDVSRGVLELVATQTDAAGVAQRLESRPSETIQALALASQTSLRITDDETGLPVSQARVDVVADNESALVLCADPSLLPTLHQIDVSNTAGASVEIKATSVFASDITGDLRSAGFWGRGGVYSAARVSARHLALLLQRSFESAGDRLNWQIAEQAVVAHLADWRLAERGNSNRGYVMVALPVSAGLDAEFKVLCYQGDGILLGSWLAHELTRLLGREAFTLSVYRYTGVSAQRLVLVVPSMGEPQAPGTGMGVLRGAVRHASGAPVAGAEVSLYGMDVRTPVLAAATTQMDGTFSFADLAAGAYFVRVRKVGYENRFLADVLVDDQGPAAVKDVVLSPLAGARLVKDASAVYAHPGQTTAVGLGIANRGTSTALTWEFSPTGWSIPPWMDVSPRSGTLLPGQVQWIRVTLPASGVPPARLESRIKSDSGDTPPFWLVLMASDAPDLVLDSANLSTSTATPGQRISASSSWSEAGAGSGSHWMVRGWLSEDHSIDENDHVLFTETHAPFVAGGSGTATYAFDVPGWVQAGEYYVAICLDGSDVLAETNESNNCAFLPLTIGAPAVATAPGPFAISSATAEYFDAGLDQQKAGSGQTMSFAGGLALPVIWTPSQRAHEYQVLRNGVAVTGWLPASVTEWIDTAIQTGLTYIYEVVARNGAGSRKTAPRSTTVTRSNRPLSEKLINGDFSQGSTASGVLPGWTAKGDFWVGQGPEFGAYNSPPGYAAGGVDPETGVAQEDGEGELSQTFSIPADATRAQLQFELNVTTTEPLVANPLHDVMTVALYTPAGKHLKTLETFGNVSGHGKRSKEYERKVYDVRTFVGQAVRLGFVAHCERPYPTVFRVDDVELVVDLDVTSSGAWKNVLRGGVITVAHGQAMRAYYIGADCQSRSLVVPPGIVYPTEDPPTSTWDFHMELRHVGIDIGPRGDTAVRPIAPGRLVAKATGTTSPGYKGYGYWCIVEHQSADQAGGMYWSLYGHFANPVTLPTTPPQNEVGLDTVLGSVGSTGTSFGTHVHLEIRRFHDPAAATFPYHPAFGNAYGIEASGPTPECVQWSPLVFDLDWLDPESL